ncbi:DUF2268 domain-containing putative Zn-dependent protease [Bacillus sp. JJ634]
MGIIQTDEWMASEFDRPLTMMNNLDIIDVKPEQLYRHLQANGMYTPNEKARKVYHHLMKQDVWTKARQLFTRYNELWNGPDVPVYIFPLQAPGFLQKAKEAKSGLAFQHAVFLFLDSHITDQELEAVLIHEYHHVCRLHRTKKEAKDYTLLDAMVMEGLAERTVAKYLGSKYLAHWTALYPQSDYKRLWNRYIEGKLNINRSNPLHDSIMLGKKGYPQMIGYWTGYQLVKHASPLSVRQSLVISAEDILKKQVL